MTTRTSSSTRLIVAEPPPAFRVRLPLTVDCSVLAAVVFAEPRADESTAMIANRELHAPALIDYEMVNVAARKASAGNEDRIASALHLYTELPVGLHSIDLVQTFAIARRYAISAHDAAYLWLAGELRTPLATFDTRLGKAAQKYLGSLQ